nr:hypothetical protein Iba_chr11dCG13560 [Ipomoea batatas]
MEEVKNSGETAATWPSSRSMVCPIGAVVREPAESMVHPLYLEQIWWRSRSGAASRSGDAVPSSSTDSQRPLSSTAVTIATAPVTITMYDFKVV